MVKKTECFPTKIGNKTCPLASLLFHIYLISKKVNQEKEKELQVIMMSMTQEKEEKEDMTGDIEGAR